VDVLSRPSRSTRPGKEALCHFSEALDAFFVEKEGTQEEKKNPLDRRIEVQRKAIEEFEAQRKR